MEKNIIKDEVIKLEKMVANSNGYIIASSCIDCYFFSDRLNEKETEKAKKAFYEMQETLIDIEYKLNSIINTINKEPAK